MELGGGSLRLVLARTGVVAWFDLGLPFFGEFDFGLPLFLFGLPPFCPGGVPFRFGLPLGEGDPFCFGLPLYFGPPLPLGLLGLPLPRLGLPFGVLGLPPDFPGERFFWTSFQAPSLDVDSRDTLFPGTGVDTT